MLESLPTYTVKELNEAIGLVLSRGFVKEFVLNAIVSKCQLKRGHLWLKLTDGKSSIDGVIWASRLSKISFNPSQEDGVLVIGKLNFWEAQARLTINIFDLKPSKTTVLRKFEIVRKLLNEEGLLDKTRKRLLPRFPSAIAILTSVPSSALADMLRTSKERWPLTKLFIISIPVQGEVASKICNALKILSSSYKKLGISAIILARGGGSREDLMVFDNEKLSRLVADFPIPVVSGIGHEDDLTVVDLVADHRAATPTAAIVDLLPSREIALSECLQKKQRLIDYISWFLRNQHKYLLESLKLIKGYSPILVYEKYKNELNQKAKLLNALSPQNWLNRGFCLVRNQYGDFISSVNQIKKVDKLNIQFRDGSLDSRVENIYNNK